MSQPTRKPTRSARNRPARATPAGSGTRGAAAGTPDGRGASPPPQSPPPAPPLRRDPWAWASALAVVPVLIMARGAPFGEPAADDFDFLDRTLFHGMGTLLDGGGSRAFWRPIPHQLYYAAFGRLMLEHPAAIGALHTLLLALASLLLYRAFRCSWDGPTAAVAASFPLLAESMRALLTWPSHFVDIGLFVFTALAIHETSRRRLPTALAGLAGALLCKEAAVVVALMLPWWPAREAAGGRKRWALACAALVAVWGVATLAIRHRAHLALPHSAGRDAALAAASPAARVWWATVGSLKAVVSLPLIASPRDWVALLGVAVLLVVAAIRLASDARARRRLANARGWIAWGTAWFALATLTIVPIFPIWAPNRSALGGIGLGILCAALGAAAQPLLLSGWVVLRLVLLGLATPAAGMIAPEAPQTGAFTDFEHLTRLQRFMRTTRQVLTAGFPHLPPGSVVVDDYMPDGLRYALSGDKALRVWYRDSTLRWIPFSQFRPHPEMNVVTLVEYQTDTQRQIVLTNPDAARMQDEAYAMMVAERLPEALALIDRSEALLTDSTEVVFRGNAAGLRAFMLLKLGRVAKAEHEARRGIGIHRTERNSRFVLAMANLLAGLLDAAQSEIDTLEATSPRDEGAAALRAELAAARARAATSSSTVGK